LTNWRVTVLCAAVVVIRLLGRLIRVEKLFREDVFAAAALVQLLLRMAFVDPVLLRHTKMFPNCG
jgi:hypothetical protein